MKVVDRSGQVILFSLVRVFIISPRKSHLRALLFSYMLFYQSLLMCGWRIDSDGEVHRFILFLKTWNGKKDFIKNIVSEQWNVF